MKKPIMERLLKEVGDLGDRMTLGLPYTVGGGVINTGVATYSSPDASQNPAQFVPSSAGSATNIKQPDETSKNPNIAKQPENVIDTQKDVEKIKYKVTPDEVITGINSELKNMVFKRPDVAKALVIQNLKRNPKYYSELNNLGINDDTVDESRKYMNKQERVIADIIKEMNNKNKRKRNI